MRAAYLEIATLSKPSKLLAAARHNLREIQAELGANSHINATKSCMNIRLFGPATAREISGLAEQAKLDAGIFRQRKNAVRAVEVLITRPPNAEHIDQSDYFADGLAWVQKFFDVPILSAVIHHDEETPHMHVLLLPLVNGQMIGSRLLGNRSRMQAMQHSFYETVACGYGLGRPNSGKRMTKAFCKAIASKIMTTLKPYIVNELSPDLSNALFDTIVAHPKALACACGIDLQQQP